MGLLLTACTHALIVAEPPGPGELRRPARSYSYPVGEYFAPSVAWIAGTARFTTLACGSHEFPYSVGSGMADLLREIDRASFSRVEPLDGPSQEIAGVRRSILFELAEMRVSLSSDRISWGTARRAAKAELEIRVVLSIDGRRVPLETVTGRGNVQDLGSFFDGCGAIADVIPIAIRQSLRAAAANYMTRLEDPKRF
ncbi:hypothetical protein [Inquilinus sp.]|uniref:hypothetical protein n=1 Tax=Inquilinus sp. TaxID=1932117 RepID=UPI003783232F